MNRSQLKQKSNQILNKLLEKEEEPKASIS